MLTLVETSSVSLLMRFLLKSASNRCGLFLYKTPGQCLCRLARLDLLSMTVFLTLGMPLSVDIRTRAGGFDRLWNRLYGDSTVIDPHALA